jgi:hypothetical protein
MWGESIFRGCDIKFSSVCKIRVQCHLDSLRAEPEVELERKS